MNENKDIALFQKNGYLIKKTTDIESQINYKILFIKFFQKIKKIF